MASKVIDNLKRRIVRRWLHLIPYQEIESFAENRRIYKAMDDYHQKMVDCMLQNYFQEDING